MQCSRHIDIKKADNLQKYMLNEKEKRNNY